MTLNDFSLQILELFDDYEGPVRATLIHSQKNEGGKPAVLYIHGYNDYFFHVHLAAKFHQNGYDFYALDLRKHGRSILPHQHQNYCRSVSEYYEEINLALEIIAPRCNGEIVLYGHSTGGLICSAFMNEGNNRHLVSSLILNAPFLEFNLPAWQKWLAVPLCAIVSFFFPYAFRKDPFGYFYGSSISIKQKGEWDFNERWKQPGGFPPYLKWVYAVYKAQRKLHRASEIEVPVLILHSDKSVRLRKWDEVIFESDIVLNVGHIKKYGRRLGKNIRFIEVKGAIHDIFLSKELIRKQAAKNMFNWLLEIRTSPPLTLTKQPDVHPT